MTAETHVMLRFRSENRSTAMSDSRRQYRAIKQAMKQLYPVEPRGNLARHLETLVFMISGIIASKSCQLPKIASKVPGDVHPDSRTKQLSRWVQNENITFELYFLPFVQPLLERLAAVRPLVLVMDGSAVARGCVTLMVSVLYAHRAIPIGWVGVGGAEANGYGWQYVCRTAKNIQIGVDDEWSSLADLNVHRSQREFRKGVWFTK